MNESKKCRYCAQPMKPRNVKKEPGEWDHATGCPYSRSAKSNRMRRLRDRIGNPKEDDRG